MVCNWVNYSVCSLKNDVKFIQKALGLIKIPFVSYEEIVSNPGNVLNMIFYCCYGPVDEKKLQCEHGYSAVDRLVTATALGAYAIMGVRINSSSDGSGCSGCGGCGGCGSCGGCGGAD